MLEKRHLIFISSTFEDLKEERQAAQDAIISGGDFPVQMESFPAADQDQFEFIKRLIDECDYYILISAGRYGSMQADGLSYTEMEFDYAVEIGIPVLVMIHGNQSTIVQSKSEHTDEGRSALAQFQEKASRGRLRKSWSSTGDLKHAIRDALDHAKKTRPAIGWVRGNSVASETALGELNEVRKENATYKELIGKVDNMPELLALPGITDLFQVSLLPLGGRGGFGSGNASGSFAIIECSWLDAFPHFLTSFQWKRSDYDGELYYYRDDDRASRQHLGEKLASEFSDFDPAGLFTISPTCFERLVSYYIEAGLMNDEGLVEEPFTLMGKQIARRSLVSNKRSFKIVKGEVSKNDGSHDIPF